jgi:hypothetical protein
MEASEGINMSLPIFKTEDQELSLMQTKWASQIDPLLTQPQASGVRLLSVTLVVGDNVINHRLGRKLQGWQLTRQRAAASIYDKQDNNNTPSLTLILNSTATVTVDLFVW